METETPISWDTGMADEERRDLENLIEAFKKDRLSPPSRAAAEELQEQMTAMKEQMIQMAAMLLEMDKQMRSLYEVFRLFHKKTELMNQRINDVVHLAKI